MDTTPETRRSATAGLLARLQSNPARLAVAALLVAAGYLLLLTYIAGRSTEREAELALGLVLIFGIFGALFLVVRPVFRAHRTLLRLFEQIARNPEALPTIPVERLPPESEERRLLAGFEGMIARIRAGQERLRESEERFGLAIRGANDGIWDWNLVTGALYLSPRWKSMLGYEDHELPNAFEAWREHVHPDDLARALATLQAHLDGETEFFRLEHRLRHRDGSYRWVLSRGASLRGADGKAYRIAGSHADLTARKEMEEALRESDTRFRSIFEATSDGLVISDLDGTVIEINPAMCRMHGYRREELIGRNRTVYIHPDHHPRLPSYTERVQESGDYRTQAVNVRKDGTTFSVEVHGSRFTYRGRPHTLGVIRDITERVEAYQLLEQRVEERTRELSTLLQISHNVASTLELGPLLGLILEQLKAVVQYTGASILTLEGDEFRQVEYRGPAPRERALALRIPLDTASHFWAMLSGREPIAIADLRGDSPDAREYRRVLGEELLQRLGYARSWLGVPLVVKDRVIGILALASGEVGHFTAQHARLLTAIATQAAVAIENARLYERAQEAQALAEQRLRELEALYRADAELYRSLRLDDVLNALVGVATEILQADKSTVMVWDEPRERLVVGAVQGFAPETVARMIHAPGEGVTSRVALTGQPIAVEDALADPRVAHRITDREGIRSLVHVPIVVDGEVFGVFGVNYCQPHPVGADVQRLLLALAQRAALAIENARLYAQAQQVGILEERQRLARELHDSVSQALYGIALGARTARTLLDRDPSQVARPLEYVLSLAEAGLAEMRALIFELRPESLETEGLVAALDKQAAALRARHQIEVRADLGAEPALPLEQKEALYRIAQEATHNTVKHARAGAIDLRLRCDDGVCVLEVADDGIGFDPGGSFPGHLGLRSMRERAERLGGALELRSAPGAGTHLRALIPTGNVKRDA